MTQTEFDRWQERFAAKDYVFGEEPNLFLARQKSVLPRSGKVLTIADGEGRNGVWLAEQGLDVLAVDFSPNGLAKARALATKRGATVQFELADVHSWSWPVAAFDVVVEIFAQFSNPQQRAGKWACMKRALKPGGLLLLEGYTPKQLELGTGGPRDLDHLYTRALLEQEFGDFAKIEIKEYEAVLSEGARHQGMSAVIDLVGWK